MTDVVPAGFRWRFGVAALAPFVVASVYLAVSRRPPHQWTAIGDYAALAVSILLGAAFLVSLPIRGYFRVMSILIYIPVLAVLLVCFSVGFIALFFHDAL